MLRKFRYIQKAVNFSYYYELYNKLMQYKGDRLIKRAYFNNASFIYLLLLLIS